jgi:hypothetical protein
MPLSQADMAIMGRTAHIARRNRGEMIPPCTRHRNGRRRRQRRTVGSATGDGRGDLATAAIFSRWHNSWIPKL